MECHSLPLLAYSERTAGRGAGIRRTLRVSSVGLDGVRGPTSALAAGQTLNPTMMSAMCAGYVWGAALVDWRPTATSSRSMT